MKAYLQKVATDITPPGRDDPSGWGVVFVRAILDTAPGGTPPPPPPPPPPVEMVQIVTTVTDGFTIRYRLDGDAADRILQIREIEMFTDGATAEASIEQARQYCREFFPNHQIVQIPKAEGLLGGAYWAGQFFKYWGKNNAKPLQVIRLVGTDEQGRSLTVTGFERAELPQGYDGAAQPRLLTFKNKQAMKLNLIATKEILDFRQQPEPVACATHSHFGLKDCRQLISACRVN
jgi:hypothetical protein